MFRTFFCISFTEASQIFIRASHLLLQIGQVNVNCFGAFFTMRVMIERNISKTVSSTPRECTKVFPLSFNVVTDHPIVGAFVIVRPMKAQFLLEFLVMVHVVVTGILDFIHQIEKVNHLMNHRSRDFLKRPLEKLRANCDFIVSIFESASVFQIF